MTVKTFNAAYVSVNIINILFLSAAVKVYKMGNEMIRRMVHENYINEPWDENAILDTKTLIKLDKSKSV